MSSPPFDGPPGADAVDGAEQGAPLPASDVARPANDVGPGPAAERPEGSQQARRGRGASRRVGEEQRPKAPPPPDVEWNAIADDADLARAPELREDEIPAVVARTRTLIEPIRARLRPSTYPAASSADDARHALRQLHAVAAERRIHGLAADLDGPALARTLKYLDRAEEITNARDLMLGAPVLSCDDIFAPLPAPRWIVPDLQWCPGRPAMIIAYAGSGKTLIVQSAAISIATGRSVFGQFWLASRSRDYRVLHLDYEQGKVPTRRRYQKLAKGMRLDDEELAMLRNRLRLIALPRIKLTSKDAATEFRRAVEGFDFCIIDSLRRATPGIDENDSRIGEVLELLTEISEDTGCAFLMIHHAGKGGKNGRDSRELGRGSSAIFDNSGAVLALELDDGKGDKASGQAPEKIEMYCPKCAGSGELAQYDHNEDGRCFRCNGTGKVWQKAPAAAEPTSTPSGQEPYRRLCMTKPSVEGDGMTLAPFYVRFVDDVDPSALVPGVRVEYRTEQQVKGPPEKPGDKLDAVKARVLAFIQQETRAGRPVAGKVVLAAAVGLRRTDVSAAVDALLAEGSIEDRPDKGSRGGRGSRLWSAPANAGTSLGGIGGPADV